MIDRRTALALTGSALVAGAIAGGARAAAPVLVLVDHSLPSAKRLAARSRAVGVEGDLVRLWRAHGDGASAVEAVTSWSDYLLLRELAAEDGLRVRSERHVRSPGAPLAVHWTAA